MNDWSDSCNPNMRLSMVTGYEKVTMSFIIFSFLGNFTLCLDKGFGGGGKLKEKGREGKQRGGIDRRGREKLFSAPIFPLLDRFSHKQN